MEATHCQGNFFPWGLRVLPVLQNMAAESNSGSGSGSGLDRGRELHAAGPGWPAGGDISPSEPASFKPAAQALERQFSWEPEAGDCGIGTQGRETSDMD